MPDRPADAANAETLETSRDEFFSAHPSPWDAIAKLEYGGDRTLAHAIKNKVLTALPPLRPALERDLIQVLEAHGTTLAGKDFACRMLALIGSKACIPAVTPLLRSSETEHLARLVLETIKTA